MTFWFYLLHFTSPNAWTANTRYQKRIGWAILVGTVFLWISCSSFIQFIKNITNGTAHSEICIIGTWGKTYKKTYSIWSIESTQNHRDRKNSVARGCGEREVGSYCSVGIEFQFYKMKQILEMEGGDGSTTLWMYLTPLNCTHNGYNGKFFYVYFTTIKFSKKPL